MLDAVPAAGLLDQADHLLDGADGVGLEPERQGEVEHRLRVGGALDRGEERFVDRQHELAPQLRELADQSVVHPQPAPVAEGMRVRLLDRRPRRRADVGEEEMRRDPSGELAQVPVVPGGMDAAVEPRGAAVVVPADPKPSPFVVVAPSLECRLWSIRERSRSRSSASSLIGEPEYASQRHIVLPLSCRTRRPRLDALVQGAGRGQRPLAVAASRPRRRPVGSAVACLLGRRRVNRRERSASSATASIAFFSASSWASA